MTNILTDNSSERIVGRTVVSDDEPNRFRFTLTCVQAIPEREVVFGDNPFRDIIRLGKNNAGISGKLADASTLQIVCNFVGTHIAAMTKRGTANTLYVHPSSYKYVKDCFVCYSTLGKFICGLLDKLPFGGFTNTFKKQIGAHHVQFSKNWKIKLSDQMPENMFILAYVGENDMDRALCLHEGKYYDMHDDIEHGWLSYFGTVYIQ